MSSLFRSQILTSRRILIMLTVFLIHNLYIDVFTFVHSCVVVFSSYTITNCVINSLVLNCYIALVCGTDQTNCLVVNCLHLEHKRAHQPRKNKMKKFVSYFLKFNLSILLTSVNSLNKIWVRK